jgi:hypothetical protein
MEICDPQDYWKLWNSLKRNNTVALTTNITLDEFEKYFSGVQSPPVAAQQKFDMHFLHEIEEYINIYNRTGTTSSFITDAPITLHEVQTELKGLKSGKAPGIDGICNEFYKYLSDYLTDPLTILFNYIWDNGNYPDKWAEGIIQPLHKKGSQNEPDNYRKLTLMSCMGKVFESIVNKRLVFQEEATGIIDPHQFGFCKGCRTSDNVFIIDTLLSYYTTDTRKDPCS